MQIIAPSESSTTSGTARQLGFGTDGATLEPSPAAHDPPLPGQQPLPMNMGTSATYQRVQQTKRTSVLLPSDPRIADKAAAKLAALGVRLDRNVRLAGLESEAR